jgi:hypothetical protein
MHVGVVDFRFNQWWASYFYQVKELICFRYRYKKLVICNLLPVPIFLVTVSLNLLLTDINVIKSLVVIKKN